MDCPFNHYKMFLFVSTNNFFFEFILPVISINTLALFKILFTWYYFPLSFYFKLFVSLNMKCVSFTQHVIR